MEQKWKRSEMWEILTLCYCWRVVTSNTQEQEFRQPGEVKTHPRWHPARTWGTQSYYHKELNLSNDLTELGSGLFPEVSRKESSLVIAWFSSCRTLSRRTWGATLCRDSEFLEYEIISGCWLKPLCSNWLQNDRELIQPDCREKNDSVLQYLSNTNTCPPHPPKSSEAEGYRRG